MSPGDFRREVVVEKLADLQRRVAHLAALGEVDPSEDPPAGRYAAERLLLLLVELAAGVNTHVAATLLGRSSTSYRASFRDAVEAGLLDAALAGRLEAAAGLRNLLVHRYGEVDTDRFVAAVPQAVADFSAYVQAVGTWLRDRDEPQTDPS